MLVLNFGLQSIGITPAAMPDEFELENTIIWVNKGVSYHIAMALKKLFIIHSIK